jgi:hypothetical protein
VQKIVWIFEYPDYLYIVGFALIIAGGVASVKISRLLKIEKQK